MSNEKPKNNFVRTLIVLFAILIIVMIIFNYFYIEPKGNISSGLITLLLILIVVVLSESFDNFSIGKLLTITRVKNEKEKAVVKLEKEKAELLSQIISITSTQTQSQNHTNVYGDYHVDRDARVEKATEEDIKNNKDNNDDQQESETHGYRTDWRAVEKIAFDKFLKERNIHKSNVIIDAKLVTEFHGIDPISNIQPLFDGYYKNSNNEMFIEFKLNRTMSLMIRERVYMMLSKLHYYKSVKEINTLLELVFINLPDTEPRKTRVKSTDKFSQDFSPAIASGLLRINEIDITSEELESCKKKKEK